MYATPSFCTIQAAEDYIRILCGIHTLVDIEATATGFSVSVSERKKFGATIVEEHENLGVAVIAAIKSFAKELKNLKREKKTITETLVESEWMRSRRAKFRRAAWVGNN